jgi:dsDNA-specific endonuclease/ATPase MutS2
MYSFIQNYPSKAKAKQNEYLKAVKKYLTMEKAKGDAALKKTQYNDRLKKEAENHKTKHKKAKQNKPVKSAKRLKIGDRVKMKGSKEIGDVIQIDGTSAKVVFGILTAKVKVADLTLV